MCAGHIGLTREIRMRKSPFVAAVSWTMRHVLLSKHVSSFTGSVGSVNPLPPLSPTFGEANRTSHFPGGPVILKRRGRQTIPKGGCRLTQALNQRRHRERAPGDWRESKDLRFLFQEFAVGVPLTPLAGPTDLSSLESNFYSQVICFLIFAESVRVSSLFCHFCVRIPREGCPVGDGAGAPPSRCRFCD